MVIGVGAWRFGVVICLWEKAVCQSKFHELKFFFFFLNLDSAHFCNKYKFLINLSISWCCSSDK